MRSNLNLSVWLILVLMVLLPLGLVGQEPADSLYKASRSAAFDAKDNPLAIRLCQQALELNPEMEHYRVFLGRLLAWEADYAEAETNLRIVLDKNPSHLDARLALLDVLLWSGQYPKLEETAQAGMEMFPENLDIRYKMGLAQTKMGQAVKAQKTFERILKEDPEYANVAQQIAGLKDALKNRKTRLILGYDRLAETQTAWQFLVVDPSLDPWSLMALEYEHPTTRGPLIFRLSSASRFASSGTMAEIEAYPAVGKTTYSYVSLGFSGSSIFPEWKGGLELFKDMGKGYEASLGLRYLKVPDKGITVFTGSVGKYLGNYWLNARTFITPQSESLSRSLNLVVRRYLADADEYLELSGGSGEVPDENLGAAEINYLSARRLEGLAQIKLRPATLMQVRISFSNQEVRTDAFRGSSGITLTLEQRF